MAPSFRTLLRFLLRALIAVVALVVVLVALFAYFAYTPSSPVPRLSGTLTKGSLTVAGLTRTYSTYVPRDLAKGAPLVVVMHGAGENGGRIRVETGYGFERLADEHGFAVVYPNAYEGYWDACTVAGDVSANGRSIDDVGFLGGMVDKLVGEIGVDPGRVFAAGSSRGGFMAFRLALEAPSRFRAVAAVSANVPSPENFKCKPAAQGTCSVMIMNGTDDPLVPFDGGSVSLFGLFYKLGKVRSSRESGQYFADLNHITGPPERNETRVAGGVRVERLLWRNKCKVEVELVAIHGGGHGIPQPYRRRPRLLGPSPMEPNGPAMIWAFFERQHDFELSHLSLRVLGYQSHKPVSQLKQFGKYTAINLALHRRMTCMTSRSGCLYSGSSRY
jgi:polyhydroxybutyrate depolymerase